MKRQQLIFIVVVIASSMFATFIWLHSRPDSTRSVELEIEPNPSDFSVPSTVSPSVSVQPKTETQPESTNDKNLRPSFDELYSRWKENLQHSQYPEDQFLAYLFAETKEQRELFLLQAYGLNPNDVLLNMEAMRFCREHKDSAMCDLPYMEFLQRKESDNAWLYIELANLAHKDGDINKALALLRQAASATRSETNEWRELELIKNSILHSELKLGVNSVFQTLAELQEQNKLQHISNGLPVHEICNPKKVAISDEWSSVCAAAWENIHKLEKNETARIFAATSFALASNMPREKIDQIYQKYTEENAVQITKTMNAISELEAALSSIFGVESDKLQDYFESATHIEILLSENSVNTYLRILKTEGEGKATEYLFKHIYNNGKPDIYYYRETEATSAP